MEKSKNLTLYIIICLLGFGVIASDIALITKNRSLQNSVSSMSELKIQYDSLNRAYNNLLKESIADSNSQQPEKETEKPTSREVEEMKTTIREKTFSTLDERISQAKTDYEIGIFTEMKQRYNNIFDLSEQFRTAAAEERTQIRNAIAEEWIALGQLYYKYNNYQWTSLAKEFDITDTDAFMKRVEEIQAGFSDK